MVAYRQVESTQMRQWRSVSTGEIVLPRDAQPLDGYWCGADKPDADETTFAIRPIYNSSKVPEGAQCEECGIDIRELQEMMCRR